MKEKDNFEFYNLISKDKAELDRIKVALEVENYKEKLEFERKKHKTDTARIIIIALLSIVITLGSTYILKYFENIRSDRKESRQLLSNLESKYLATTNPTTKHAYACQISEIYNPQNDPFVEKEMKEYLALCNIVSLKEGFIIEENDIINRVEDKIKDSIIIKQLTEADSTIYALKEKQKSEGSLSENETAQLEAANDEIQILSNSNEFLKDAINASETIMEQQMSLIDTLSSKDDSYKGNKIIKTYDVKWFKEGYFIRYNEIRILLQKLDKKRGIEVEVCNESGTSKCQNPILTNEWIYIDQPLKFTSNSKNYMISLKSIGRAGKNPFKLATYIDIVELER